MNRRRLCLSTFAALSLAVVVTGCARSGVRLEHQNADPGAPKVRAILADLAENDTAIESFSARGTVKAKLPGLKARKKFRATAKFRRPSDFILDLRHYGTFAKVLHLLCSGDRVVAESRFADLEEDESLESLLTQYLGPETRNADFEESGTGDAVREIFFPEDWAKVKARRVRIVEHKRDSESGATSAVLELPARDGWKRRITVSGAPWVLVESELLDQDGIVIVRTCRGEFRVIDGIRFPAHLEIEFPAEEAHLEFDLKEFDVNVDFEPATFSMEASE